MLSSKKNLLIKCEELGIKCSKSLPKEKIIELINQKEKTQVIEIQNLNNIKVKYIYHLADIHIRYLERHEEYKLVFDKLYENIKKDPNRDSSILVICGDIFHNRDRFVSETIILFNDFIKNLSSLIEVFLIVGNHDCFNHSDRLDSISGITSIKDYKNFHLLKNSGTYIFANISFGVSSLLDCLGLPPPINSNKTNVALYHGIVSGCVLDNGTSSNDGFPMSNFNGYDLVLLGDVHRRQYLNKDKTIAYPGSLIQQNFKEELHHGYLKWNIETKTSEFCLLENDYCFMDIPVKDTINLEAVRFTKFTRIRLIIDPLTTEQEINNTIDNCRKFTEVISIKKIIKDTKLLSNFETQTFETVNDSEISIIKNNVPQEFLDEVLALHSKLLDGIDYEENYVKSLPWTIEKIEFRNIFSYGDDILNCINLQDGITGILANNASGKTNILNTIIYGLFGLSRTQNHLNKNIISRYSKKEDLLVRLTIVMVDGTKYYIERSAKTKTRSRIKSSEIGQIDLVETLKFYNDDKNLNLGSKLDTEKLIKDKLSILGKEEFVLTNMMSNLSYGANMSIISMTGTQLDEVFNNIFNLNKYKLLHKESKTIAVDVSNRIKELNIKLKLTETSLSKYNYLELCDRQSFLEQELELKLNSLEEYKVKLKNIDENLLKMQKIEITSNEKSLKNKLQELEDELSRYNGNILELLEREQDLERDYDLLIEKYIKSDTLSLPPKEHIKESVEDIKNLIAFNEGNRRDISFDPNLTNEYLKAKKYISSISSDSTFDINKIKTILDNLSIDTSKKYYKLPVNIRNDIMTDLSKTYVDPNLILKYRKIIEDKESSEKIIAENIIIDQKINSLKKLLKNRKIQDAHEIKEKLLDINESLDYIEFYKEKICIQNDLKTLKENKEVNALISEKIEISESLENLQSLIKNYQIELTLIVKDIKTSKELQANKNILLPEINDLSHKLDLYKIYIDLTHQKNLPKFLISKVIKNITSEANELIYNTTGLLCEIQENEKWEIVIKKGNLTLGPEHCSGYERFLINTALKISFDKYKQLSSIKLFMIDETIDCVSESNFEQIDVLLEYLNKHYNKVILISHNEDLKKKVNHRIGIDIVQNCSRIS